MKNLKNNKAGDLLVLEIILTCLSQVCVFLPEKKLTQDCLKAAKYYNDASQNNVMRIFGKFSLTSSVINENKQISDTLQSYVLIFELDTFVVKQFPVKTFMLLVLKTACGKLFPNKLKPTSILWSNLTAIMQSNL